MLTLVYTALLLTTSVQSLVSLNLPETGGKFKYLPMAQDKGHRLSAEFKVDDQVFNLGFTS